MREFDNLLLASAIAFNAAPFMSDQTPEPPLEPQFLIQRVGKDFRASLTRPTINAFDQLLARGQVPPTITVDLLASAVAEKGLIPNTSPTIGNCAEAIAQKNPQLFTEKDSKGKPKRAILLTPLTRGSAEFVIDLPSICTTKTENDVADANRLPAATTNKADTSHHGAPQDEKIRTYQEQLDELRTTILCTTGSLALLGITIMGKLMSMQANRHSEPAPAPRANNQGSKGRTKILSRDDDEYFEPSDTGGSITAGEWPQQPHQVVLPPVWLQLPQAPHRTPVIIDGSVVNESHELATARTHDDRELIYQNLYRNPDTGKFDVLPTSDDYEARRTTLALLARHEPQVLRDILDGRTEFSTMDVRDVYPDLSNDYETLNTTLTSTDLQAVIQTGTYELEEGDPAEDGDPGAEEEEIGSVHGDNESSIQLKDIGSRGDHDNDWTKDPNNGNQAYLHPDDHIDESRVEQLPVRQLKDD